MVDPDEDAPATEEVVVRWLRAAGCVFAEDEARLLLEAARSPEALMQTVARRCAGEPLEVILGWAAFCGLRVAVTSGVFVPRTRTELLVREAVRLTGPDDVVVDLCCGSGAVGMAVHAAVPGIELHASDIESTAVRCARRNLEPLGGAVHEGDLFAPLPPSLRGRVATLVVNAPYVPTDAIALLPPEARDHEPHITLDGGVDGIDIQRRVAVGAGGWLRAGGHLLIETSASQELDTVDAVESAGLVSRIVAAEELGTSIVIGTPG